MLMRSNASIIRILSRPVLLVMMMCVAIAMIASIPCSSLRIKLRGGLKMNRDSSFKSNAKIATQVRQWVQTAPLNDARIARSQVRGTGGAVGLTDAAVGVMITNHFRTNAVLGAGLGLGRVEEVYFGVGAVVAYPGHVGGGDADAICDALFNPQGYPAMGVANNALYHIDGEARTRTGKYENGHIIGTALTLGANEFSDPINFFPQHYQSNGHNSKWWRMERIAQAVRVALDNILTAIPHGGPASGPLCAVNAHIEFTYAGANPYLPSGGAYEVRTSTPCFNELCRIVAIATTAALIRNTYTQSYCNTNILPAVWRVGGLAHPSPLLARIDERTAPVGVVAGGGPTPTFFPRIAGYGLRVNWLNQKDQCVQNNLPFLGGPGGAFPGPPYPPIAWSNNAIRCPALYP